MCVSSCNCDKSATYKYCHSCIDRETRELHSVDVELALPKPLITWSGGLHHLKECCKDASELKARLFLLRGKIFFNFLYKSLWGYKKPQHYLLKSTRILSRAFPPTAHVNHLFLTIDTKLRYLATFLATPFILEGWYQIIWVLSSC